MKKPTIDLLVQLELGSESQREAALGMVKALAQAFASHYDGRRAEWPHGHKDNRCVITINDSVKGTISILGTKIET